METIWKSTPAGTPKLSIVLLDWSCRESFHSLRYLAEQTVPRDLYEILWIEYYDRRSPELRTLLDEAKAAGRPAPIDQWIVMDIPRSVYYHKHLMYNVGIVAGRGEILTLCDSDAMFRPTFVQTILESFRKDPQIVLHMDQVRNNDRRFYPFNYPSIAEVTGPGAINFAEGTTLGLKDKADILHTRNYGACFSALRSDLIAIGGADEHTDFVGHICGPYDLTFRLANYGRREIWHPEELLYHVWHPGQAGERNYLGPHDGRHMSTTSLAVRATGRIQPLQENPALSLLRRGEDQDLYAALWDQVLPSREFERWTLDVLEQGSALQQQDRSKRRHRLLDLALHPRVLLSLLQVFSGMLLKYLRVKVSRFSRRPAGPRELIQKPFKAIGFLRRSSRSIAHSIGLVLLCLEHLWNEGIREVYVFGLGPLAEITSAFQWKYPFKVKILSDYDVAAASPGLEHLPVEAAVPGSLPILVEGMMGGEDRVERLLNLGIARKRIVMIE